MGRNENVPDTHTYLANLCFNISLIRSQPAFLFRKFCERTNEKAVHRIIYRVDQQLYPGDPPWGT